MDNLPVVTIKTRETNPDYVPIFVDGEQWPVNRQDYDMDIEVEAEVLQLNLTTGGMRVRYKWPERGRAKMKTVTKDVSNVWFFAKYSISAK